MMNYPPAPSQPNRHSRRIEKPIPCGCDFLDGNALCTYGGVWIPYYYVGRVCVYIYFRTWTRFSSLQEMISDTICYRIQQNKIKGGPGGSPWKRPQNILGSRNKRVKEPTTKEKNQANSHGALFFLLLLLLLLRFTHRTESG